MYYSNFPFVGYHINVLRRLRRKEEKAKRKGRKTAYKRRRIQPYHWMGKPYWTLRSATIKRLRDKIVKVKEDNDEHMEMYS